MKLWEKSYPESLKNYQVDPSLLQANLASMAKESAEKYGSATAFTFIGSNDSMDSISYQEVDTLSTDLSRYYIDVMGLKRGDVVAIQLLNSLHYPIAAFAAWKAGLIVTNVNPLYTARELEHQLVDSGAKLLIVIDFFASNVEPITKKLNLPVILASLDDFANTNSHDVSETVPGEGTFLNALAEGGKFEGGFPDLHPVALYQYTGGTTGQSKGAIITHANIFAVLSMAKDYVAAYGVEAEEGSTVLTVLPMYHIFAFNFNFLLFFKSGGQNLLVPIPRPLTNLKPAFDNFDIDWMTGVDTLFNGLLNEDWFTQSKPKIGFAVSGGTALRSSTATLWRDQVSPILEGYGMTETSCFVSFCPPNVSSPEGSVGLPMVGCDVAILNEEGKKLPAGTPGELVVRGPHVIESYLNRPEETQSAIQNGWLHTGDIAEMDEQGFIKIVDRKKDMILVSGFNVYPNEIEDVLGQCPGVLEAAVIGVENDNTGEAVRAYIVKQDLSLTESDVVDYCRDQLTAYKIPKQIVFRQELPKSPIGKILRAKLREPELA